MIFTSILLDPVVICTCFVSYGSRCIKFKASQIWNTIPEELKLTTATNQQQNLKLLRKNKNKKNLKE